MIAATLPRGILDALSRSAVAPKTKATWSWDSIPTRGAIFLIVVAVVAGAYGMYRAIAEDVPEMKRGIQGIDKKLGEMEIHRREEQASRARADNSIRVLQTNMIAVIQKVERRTLRPGEIREIMASVQEVSRTEAPGLSQPVVSGEPPKMPPGIVAMAEKFEPGFAAIIKGRGADSRLESIFAKMIVAKNAKWEAADQGIRVTYDGGSAFFNARSANVEEVRKRVELYNALSHGVSQTVGSEENAAHFIKKPLPQREPSAPLPGSIPAPGTPPTSSPQMRAPDLPRSLEGQLPVTK